MKNYEILIDYYKNGKILECQSIELMIKAKSGEDAVKRLSDAMQLMNIGEYDYRIIEVTLKGKE